jgi:hypothetical protein
MNERDATTRWQIALACVVVAAGVWFSGPAAAATTAPAASERQKIDALINAVEVRKDLKFERLGTVHSSKEAAQMLRTKLRAAGSQVKTVDDFIDHVASATASGSTYYVLYPDGRRTPSAEFLRSELKRINTSSRSTTP